MKELFTLLFPVMALLSCQPDDKSEPPITHEPAPPPILDESKPPDAFARLREISASFATPHPQARRVLLTGNDIQLILAVIHEHTATPLSREERTNLKNALLLGETSDGSNLDQILLDTVRNSMDSDPPFRILLLQIIDSRSRLNQK